MSSPPDAWQLDEITISLSELMERAEAWSIEDDIKDLVHAWELKCTALECDLRLDHDILCGVVQVAFDRHSSDSLEGELQELEDGFKEIQKIINDRKPESQ